MLRLKQEFRALADVAHPNLLALYDLFVDDESCFFTMEIVDGVDVVSFIRREAARSWPARPDATETDTFGDAPSVRRRPEARFDEARLRDALAQLSAGIAELHAHGLCHRDLKPSNVLVRPDGRVLILDYGLVTEREATGDTFEGTAAYAAPEQAHGDFGPPADGYALGVIAFEAITGTLPFDGTPLQMLVDKRQREAPRLDAVVDGVPSDLIELVATLLARDPARRRLGAFAREAPLVGREKELAILETAFAAGGGRTVVIDGPSGIGKTSLVRAFLARARARGAVVLEGRCNPRETVPYNAFDGVIDALAHELRARTIAVDDAAITRLFPVLGGAPSSFSAAIDADAIRRRAFAELRGLLGRLGPLVIFVDDFQWADRDSQVLLNEIVKVPALFLLTQRGDAHPLPWAAERIELAALSAEASRELLARTLGGEPARRDSQIQALLSIADGHPLFLQELARVSGAEPPRDLEHALRTRIAALGADERAILELAAVAAAPLPAHLLARAAERGIVRRADGTPTLSPSESIAEAMRNVDSLRIARLLRVADRGVEPFHDRVREAVLTMLSDDERRARHAALVRALGERGDPRTRVHHLAGAGDHGAAREAALSAALRAEESLAFEQGALLLRDAMAYGADGDEVRLRLAEALANAHRGVEAAEVYLSIHGAERARARARAAELLLASGDITRGRAVVSELLDEIDRPLPKTAPLAVMALAAERAALAIRGFVPRRGTVAPSAAERADLFRGVAQGLGMADNLRAALYNTRSLRAALDLGDPVRAAIALATESIFRGSVDVRKPRDLLERARALAEETGDETARAWVSGADATLDALTLEHPDVVNGLLRAEAYFQERTRGNGWALDSLKLVRGLTQRLLGEVEALRARLPEDLADAQRRGDRYLETTLLRGATQIWLCDGDVARAREAIEGSAWTSFRDGFHIQHWLELEGHAEIDLYEGNASTTLDRFRGEHRALRLSLVARLQRPRILSRTTRGKLLLSRAATRRDRTALIECTWLAKQLWNEDVGYARVRALLLRAGVAGLRRDHDTAITALRDAIAIADRIGLALTAAVARRRLAARLGGDEGRSLKATSDRWMHDQRIAEPSRIADVEAPFA